MLLHVNRHHPIHQTPHGVTPLFVVVTYTWNTDTDIRARWRWVPRQSNTAIRAVRHSVGKERKRKYARSSSHHHVPHSGEESASGSLPQSKQRGEVWSLWKVLRLGERRATWETEQCKRRRAPFWPQTSLVVAVWSHQLCVSQSKMTSCAVFMDYATKIAQSYPRYPQLPPTPHCFALSSSLRSRPSS
jgi:hypothetical protein